MEYKRKLTLKEEELLEFLIKKSSDYIPKLNWKKDITVEPLNDGNIGSLRLFQNGNENKNEVYGKTISEYQFNDLDGIPVIVSLYIDKNDNLFELDFWKVDFSKILSLPNLDFK